MTLLCLLLVTGCGISAISPAVKNIPVPDTWQAGAAPDQSLTTNWLQEFGDDELTAFVVQALASNFQLAEQKARLQESRAAIIISRAARLPELNLQLAASRRRSVLTDSGTATTSRVDLGVELAFELDFWGRLSDVEQQALLLFKAQEAAYLDSRLRLATDVARAWFNVLTAKQLLNLFDRRLQNLKTDAEIVNSGYQQGINAALDVYQNQATLEQERARLLEQRQTLLESKITLENLLATYPEAAIAARTALPEIDAAIPAGLPAELLTRRPDLQRRWLELLAADEALAIAHKQRFPRLTLLADGRDVASTLGNVFDGSSLAWSVAGNVSQPLFNAGRLKALQDQAGSRVVQSEQRYLDAVYRAFAEAESTIARDRSLRQQYQAIVLQERSAEHARVLSFEQYQRGLVSYTTVLEAQRRAFDAQSRLIELRNQQIQTRINLYQALGGQFSAMP